jgi:hypothetical protein
LNNKSEKFLEVYDETGEDGKKDGVIDLFELQAKKSILAADLNKERTKEGSSQLGDIVQTMIELETEINKYRRGFYYGASEEKVEENKNEAEELNQKEEIKENHQIDLDE